MVDIGIVDGERNATIPTGISIAVQDVDSLLMGCEAKGFTGLTVDLNLRCDGFRLWARMQDSRVAPMLAKMESILSTPSFVLRFNPTLAAKAGWGTALQLTLPQRIRLAHGESPPLLPGDALGLRRGRFQ